MLHSKGLIAVLHFASCDRRALRTTTAAKRGASRLSAEKRWTLIIASLAGFLTPLLHSSTASAIPAFARRYETSCQTCHIVFPRLTPFGEAFRRNAYRFPEGADATMEKDEPVALGADAQRDVFPGAVYPGQLPGKVPISIMIEGTAAVGPHIETHMEMPGMDEGAAATPAAEGTTAEAAPAAEEHHHDKSVAKFDQLGGQARLLSGGSFGSIGGFFASISFTSGPPTAEVERATVIFTPLDQTSLLIKVGKFEPSLHGVSIHRGMLGHQLRLTTMMVGLNGFMPEHALQGFEVSGLVLGRLGWTAGVVENTVPVEGYAKDFYGRVEGKLGGMRLDGVGGQAASAAWRERSATFGVSAYRGKSVVGSMPGMAMPDDHEDQFLRVGGDVHVIVDDLLFDAVVVRQRHDAPLATVGESHTMDSVYAEATYMTLPWLFPTVRFEASKLRGGPVDEDPRWIGIVGVNALVRANLTLRGQVAAGVDPGSKPGFRFASLAVQAAF